MILQLLTRLNLLSAEKEVNDIMRTDNKGIQEVSGTVAQRVAIRNSSLPPRYMKIIKWIGDNHIRIPFISCKAAHEEIGLHQYDLVKFSKMIGYSGWTELKQALLNDLTMDLYLYHGEQKKSDIARIMYKNFKKMNREVPERGCRRCMYEFVFRISNKWYFDTRNGEPEPEVRYCPGCGEELRRKK